MSLDFNQTLPTLFEVQAARTPDAVAVVDSLGSLTYRELNRRADQLAVRLRTAGIGPGSIVGVLLDRSATMITAWLGVLKSGGAYLPMDAAYPAARLQFMLTDAGVRVVIASSDTAGALSGAASIASAEPAGVALLTVDGLDWSEHSESDPAGDTSWPPAGPTDLAYLIYTSGSTGTPKGVLIAHRSIVNTAGWYIDAMQIAQGDPVGQTAASGFDIASCEIWANLLAGAQLHLPSDALRQSPEQLCGWICASRLTSVHLVTPVAQLAIDNGWLQQSSLRWLATAGERLHARPPADAPYRLLNMYGPTEAAVFATCAEIGSDGEGAPSIGRPIPNTTAYVLDANQQVVPDGTEGELYLGGVGVARGYLNRPELTAQRFVADPFQPTGVLYRTGDWVRWGAHGIDYLGRIDHQVKVRGYRIEPGEIEAQLRLHPAVGEAVVTVWQPQIGHSRLVGYISPGQRETALPDSSELRRWLGDRLPQHLVPALLVPLPALPLTPNQKVDRAALPDPAAVLVQLTENDEGQALFEPEQATLAALWRQACGVSPRTAEDSLAGLGAGSLDLISLQSLLASQHGRSVPASALCVTQTLREQAESIARLALDQPSDPVAGATQGRGSHAQEAIVFLEEVAGTGMGYQYQMALEGPGTPDIAVLGRALLAVLGSQPALSNRWQMTAAGLVGRPEKLESIQLPRHVLDSAEVPELLDKLVGQALSYDDFPLIGWDLIQSPGGTVLLQREHHLIHDGWSVGVFLSALQDAYRCFERQQPWQPDIGAPTYFDWARQQRDWVDGPASEAARAYWAHHLAEAPQGRPAVPWPTSPELSGVRSELRLQPLGVERSARLNATAAALEVTPYALLLAAFRQLVFQTHLRDASVIGSGFANRDASTRDIVGMFVNVLPLLRKQAPSETVLDSARAEMALIVESGAHQGLPTSEVVRLTGAGSSLAHNPLYQIMFSQHDAPQPALRLGSWQPSVRELSNGYGKTDLNVIILNRGLQHGRSSGHRLHNEFTLRWEHDIAHYPGHVVAVLQRRLNDLLDHACAHPSTAWPASDIDWSDASDD